MDCRIMAGDDVRQCLTRDDFLKVGAGVESGHGAKEDGAENFTVGAGAGRQAEGGGETEGSVGELVDREVYRGRSGA